MRRHGLSGTKGWVIWSGLLKRCNPNGNTRATRFYADRGIRVCERWRVFENFIADMGQPPPGLSLDRIDTFKGYCPENCRWATKLQQQNNMRNSCYIEYRGRRQTAAQWSAELGIPRDRLYLRVKAGLPAELILSQRSFQGLRLKDLL